MILRRGTNKGLVVSRVGVDIVVFPISLHQRHFIWRKRLELFLPLRVLATTVLKPAAESRFSVCCVLAQPAVSIRSAIKPIRLNAVNIFMPLS